MVNFQHCTVSPSSAAACKFCGGKIDKGTLRFGQNYGRHQSVAWTHLTCASNRDSTKVNALGYKVPVCPNEARLPTLHGWASLRPAEQAAVHIFCTATWAPREPLTIMQGKKRKAEDDVGLGSLKVAELKERLVARGLDDKGKKPVLLERLQQAMAAANDAPILVD